MDVHEYNVRFTSITKDINDLEQKRNDIDKELKTLYEARNKIVNSFLNDNIQKDKEQK